MKAADMTDYDSFLSTKRKFAQPVGFDAPAVSDHLFPFQAQVVRWALRRGRAAIFAGTGMGKTLMQLDWAKHVSEHAQGDVLIVAPLAVATQTVHEGEKFGIAVSLCREASDVRPGLNITNYERFERFDATRFAGVVLDESSILKSHDGKTRTALIEAWSRTKYRLACTATPAPNDVMELANHAEFLGIASRTEMLATYFVHDGGETQKWRLKGHAEEPFYEWLASWSVMFRSPSDLGYDDSAYVLPALNMHQHIVDATEVPEGLLFAVEAQTLIERNRARKTSTDERAALAAAIVNAEPNEPWLIWCDLNAEANAVQKLIPGAVQVAGADLPEVKEQRLLWFIGNKCLCSQKNGASTIEHGSPQTAHVSKTIAKRLEKSALPPDANNMQLVQNYSSDTVGKRQHGKSPTRKNGSRNDSSHSELPPTIIDASLIVKAEAVQSAEPQNPRTYTKDAVSPDFTLTTATSQSEYADFSAPNAISESESSPMTPNASNVQQCTCGHKSGRRVLVSKSSICGFGMNFQHAARVVFVGLSDSWEAYFQAIRRCWRFGQLRPVECHVVISSAEGSVLKNIERKEREASKMLDAMVRQVQIHSPIGKAPAMIGDAVSAQSITEDYSLYQGDCVEVVRALPNDSVHYSIFSPPFASLYTYTDSERDMGNVKDHAEFYEHFGYIVKELYRVLKPGRLLSFHCMNLPTSKVRDGVIGLTDFRGNLIRMFADAGFIFHSEVCIWKDPVTAMQRTKAIGLLYKQLRKDSALSRQGIPDYLVTMRKPGENTEPVTKTHDSFPVGLWQNYASPVWMDINPSDTLQKDSAREDKDERHIAPLQLEVIRRAIRLWTNEGDTVLTPFLGIGSEAYVAVQMRRRAVGAELKASYYGQAAENLRIAVMERDSTLFAVDIA